MRQRRPRRLYNKTQAESPQGHEAQRSLHVQAVRLLRSHHPNS